MKKNIMWIHLLYLQLKDLDSLPSRNNIDKNMAEDFSKKFPNTRVILDATEISTLKTLICLCPINQWSKNEY